MRNAKKKKRRCLDRENLATRGLERLKEREIRAPAERKEWKGMTASRADQGTHRKARLEYSGLGGRGDAGTTRTSTVVKIKKREEGSGVEASKDTKRAKTEKLWSKYQTSAFSRNCQGRPADLTDQKKINGSGMVLR